MKIDLTHIEIDALLQWHKSFVDEMPIEPLDEDLKEKLILLQTKGE